MIELQDRNAGSDNNVLKNTYIHDYDKSGKYGKSLEEDFDKEENSMDTIEMEKIKFLEDDELSKIMKNFRPTHMDYESLPIDEVYFYDKRHFFEYFWFCFQKTNNFLYAFYHRSLMIPQLYRIYIFFSEVIFMISFNGVYLADRYITERILEREINVVA